MKWLIWGSKGWIGQMVCKLLQEKGETVVDAESRADDEQEVLKELLSVQPDRMMSFIGRTHGGGYSTIDYLEQKGTLEINVRDNLYGPMVLAILAHKLGIHFTYLGTGCIFEYEDWLALPESHGFGVNSKPNFFGSSYSTVKGFTDRLMHLYPTTVLNARIRMPITNYHNPRNLVTKLTKYEKICSIPNSMTVLPELLPYLIDRAIAKETGTINLTNHGTITHNEILDMYTKYVDQSFTYKNFTLGEQSRILDGGRSNNFLETSPNPEINDIRTAVENMMKSWKS